MKHLKTFQIFENQDVLSAGLENAVKNNNLQLIKDLVDQHDIDPSMDDNMALEIALQNANKEIVDYLLTFASVITNSGKTLDKLLKYTENFDLINIIQNKVKEYGGEFNTIKYDATQPTMKGDHVLVSFNDTYVDIMVYDEFDEFDHSYDEYYYKLDSITLKEIISSIDEHEEFEEHGAS